uniref:Uncharacterized protein n=1 Tax=Octopus bimaculoides TaxID=37653 RepID=A0A0L8FGM2_OCTBM
MVTCVTECGMHQTCPEIVEELQQNSIDVSARNNKDSDTCQCIWHATHTARK